MAIEKYIKEMGTTLAGDSYRYKTSKGEISLLFPSWVTQHLFEIFCIDGDLFEDIERYDSLEEAEERINQLLN